MDAEFGGGVVVVTVVGVGRGVVGVTGKDTEKHVRRQGMDKVKNEEGEEEE